MWMRDYGPAVEWYRNCIHQKQRTVSTLSIEVGLEAQDSQNPGALAETMECLDTTIAILEQAKAIRNVTAEPEDARSKAELVSPSQQLMDDLGHSMALFDLGIDAARDGDRSPFRDALSPGASDWLSGVVEDSPRFFE